MRIISISAAVIVVAFAGYSGAWYMQGKANLRAVEERLANVADNAYIESFSYESLDLKGYPFSIKIDIAKPKFKVKLAALLETMKPGPLANKNPSQNTVEFFSSDSIQMKTNVFGSYYRISSLGDLMTVAHDKEKAVHLKQTHDDNIMKVKMKFWDTLTTACNLEKVLELPVEDSFKLIKSIQMKSSDVVLSDALTEKTMLTADKIDYSIYNNSVDEGYIDVGIDYDVDNYKTTPDYAKSMKAFVQALGLGDVALNLQAESEVSASGSFHYAGPMSQAAFMSMANPIDLDFDMDYDSNLYQFKTKSQLKVDYNDANFDEAILKSKGNLHFKPGSHDSLVEVYAGLLEDLPMSNLDNEQKSLKDFVQKNLKTLVPRLEDLGKIKMDVDMNVHSDGSLMKMVIDKLSTSNDLYGVSVKGQLKANPMIPIPAGDITITMDHMDVFFDRSQNYVDLVLKYHQEQNRPMPPFLDKNTVSKVKRFVRELATEDKDDQVVWQLSFTHTEPFVQVGDKKASDIQELFVEIFLAAESDDSEPAPEPASEPVVESTVEIDVSSESGVESTVEDDVSSESGVESTVEEAQTTLESDSEQTSPEQEGEISEVMPDMTEDVPEVEVAEDQ